MSATDSRRLGWTLALGAVADWLVGIPLLVAPKFMVNLLRMPAIADSNSVYVRLIGVLLIALGVFYLLTSINPERYLGNVGAAIFGRTFGAAFYLWYLLAAGG